MNTVITINIFTAVAVTVVGVLILTGLIPFKDSPTRIIFGIIFISYGIFRYLNIRAKLKVKKQNDLFENLEKAKKDLIDSVKKKEL